ncbi:dihydroorotate dehydrogenase electron transfer subunit [uncultured Flavonifractor sp.]|uniref:dihydroorotate dehydrogenase electron transfer subunit n=1 Tax=uncultured Flavonifractor sp. TaxID=1193534 RepID=UPI00262D3DB5|nr:dihydroorotate dehydrogenase electron transfer subunit [uncultured Flavonifractor sp.]
MPIVQRCTVVEMTPLNDSTWWMTLEVGKLVEEQGLRAGQFLHVACGEGNLLRRPISVAYALEDEPENTATLIFEVKGAGTRWLSRRRAGDVVDVLGPLGNGFAVEEGGRYLLVGGGIGVPPLLGYAEGFHKNTVAVLGFRSADRVILADRFRNCCKEIYLCTDDGSMGRHGFVDAQVRDILAKDKNFTAILACGPRPMLKSVAQAAAAYGVPCQVSMEERMACGVGACLGCAIQMADGTMKHVCKDGPVFDAGEVDWNV